MNEAAEGKRLAVIEMLKKNYNLYCRLHRGTPKHTITIKMYLEKFPKTRKLTLDELEAILFDIGKEKDYKGKITVQPLNDNNARIKHDYYPVRVTPKTFPHEMRSEKKPDISYDTENWYARIPGQKIPIIVGRRGSLTGELFAVLGKRWGGIQLYESVLNELDDGRVTDQRTNRRHSTTQIKQALRQINTNLKEGTEKRTHRIGKLHDAYDAKDTIGLVWENLLWNAKIVMRKGVPMVGFVRVREPTRVKKKVSK